MTHLDTPLVVVGVDGSECSRDALRFAVAEARMRGARLHVVTAWSVPVGVYAGSFAAPMDYGTFESSAAAISTGAVAEVHELAPELDVDASTPDSQAASALLEASEHADLLVVGSRGHGGFARLLLGSVSAQLAHHAPCPVTIIRSAG
jgi:nucleotide-binding universal stress UspA family protein